MQEAVNRRVYRADNVRTQPASVIRNPMQLELIMSPVMLPERRNWETRVESTFLCFRKLPVVISCQAKGLPSCPKSTSSTSALPLGSLKIKMIQAPHKINERLSSPNRNALCAARS
jgi:hypothetical protein